MFDGEDGAPPCCVKGTTAPFEGPSWVEIIAGPGAVGSCPEGTTPGLEAYANMEPLEPHACGACSCSPAACTLPEGIHTNAAKCADADGSLEVPLGPAPASGWEGVCSEEGALPAGIQCGGEPCAQSVSVPVLPVSPCMPQSGPAPPLPVPTWGKTALECKLGPLSAESCGPGEVCAPLPPPEGFALCVVAEGEQATCPAAYPVRSVFFRDVEDGRGCETCQCSPQEGADCLAIVSVFSDTACGAFAGGVVVTEQDASCFDVVPGTALASMEASMVVDVPGSCTATGGAPFGGLLPADPITLCCQGDTEPPG